MLSECQNTTPYRVVQWTTGNVGKSSVQAITANTRSNSSGATRGQMTRSVLNSAVSLGFAATNNDVDALLALKPDVVVYNPSDELVRMLEAGVNVVATASFITGHNQGEGHDRIA